jgi:hypothetical protein
MYCVECIQDVKGSNKQTTKANSLVITPVLFKCYHYHRVTIISMNLVTKIPSFSTLPTGIIFSHGPYWKELRRFLLRNLRDFGFGKSSMEDLFIEEVSKLCQLLSKSEGHPIDMSCTMSVSIVNALWAIIVGERFDLEDPKLLHVVESINKLINGSNPSSPLGAILPSPAMVSASLNKSS